MTDIPDPPQSTEDILAMTRWLEAVTLKLRGITEGRDLSVAQAAAQLVLNGAVVNGSTNPASPVTPRQVDTSPPPQPTGLSVSDGMGTIFISWNAPAITYSYRTEIFEASVDDLGQATKVWSGTGTQAVIRKSDINTYYYWIRFSRGIDSQPLTGPFNATAGTAGNAAALVGTDEPFLYQNGRLYINSAAINEVNINTLTGDTAGFVTANITEASITNAMIGGEIRSDDYVAGQSGWIIKK